VVVVGGLAAAADRTLLAVSPIVWVVLVSWEHHALGAPESRWPRSTSSGPSLLVSSWLGLLFLAAAAGASDPLRMLLDLSARPMACLLAVGTWTVSTSPRPHQWAASGAGGRC